MSSAPSPRVAVAVDDLAVLLPDWRTHLRARNVAPSTIASYLRVGENLVGYLREAGMPTTAGAITRDHVEAFLAALMERVSPATVAKHYRSMQQLFRWLTEDRRRDSTIPDGAHAPAGRARAAGRHPHRRRAARPARRREGQHLREPPGHRDAAHAHRHRLARGELAGLNVDNLDSGRSVALVIGKGRRGRAVPYGTKTADALRRYLRARTTHPRAALPALHWGSARRER